MTRLVVRASLEDATHLAPSQIQRIIDSYPEHERTARVFGLPILGSGIVYNIPTEHYTYESFPIPKHWPVLAAIDVGVEHPTAAIKLAIDQDTDTYYVTACYRQKGVGIPVHAAALKPWNCPWVYPHDVESREKGSGESLASQFREHGLDMVARATLPDGGMGVEAGIAMVHERLETGRLKIASHLKDLLDELRLYHRKDGRIAKVFDDAVDCLRYAVVGARYAGASAGWNNGPLKRGIRGII